MKRMFTRLTALFTIVLLIAGSCFITVGASDSGDIVILYTNDVHCSTEGYAKLAAYRAQLISEGNTVITVDAGDAIQGEIIGSLTEGAAVVDIMNAVGYDYAIPGNHEFDYTVPTFLSLAADNAEYDYLCANFRYLPESKDIFPAYAIEQVGGKKIAIIGISTPETYTKSTPTYFQDENGSFIYSFLENEFYQTIQAAVDNAVAEGADTVIAIGHLGITGTTEGWRSIDVIANTDGIDGFIDGHAHEVIEGDIYNNADGEEVTLSSTGTKFAYIGKMTVGDEGDIATELVSLDSIDTTALSEGANNAYNEVKGIIDGYNDEFEYLYEVIGNSEAYLTENDADGNWIIRCGETNLGNFVTDAYIAATGADIAFVNGGGVRAEIKQGEVTRKAVMDINPWNNEMCVLKVSGSQILDALEYGVSAMPDVFGSFPHVAGLSFEVHTYLPSPVIVNELGDFVSIPDGAERRVKNVKVNGEALSLDKTYTIAGSCYMLQLSGYKMFDGAEVIAKDGLPTDTEVLVKYVTETLGGTITSERYGDIRGEGRMTVISEKPDSSTEVPPTGDTNSYVIWVTTIIFSLALSISITKTHKGVKSGKNYK